MSEFNRLEFIKNQRPREPFTDWRVWSLFVPSLCSALGFVIFAIIGYSFTEFSAISEVVRLWLVLVGGISLAIGGEVGTIFTTIEIGRKHKLDDVNGWDWIAMGFSLATTLAGFVLGLATLLGEFASWSRIVQVWGSIAVGALAGFDAYFGYWETGYLFADYTKRVKSWFLEMEQEQQKSAADIHNPIADLHKRLDDFQEQLERMQWPIANIQDVRRIVQGCNGSKAKLTPDKQGFSQLEQLLSENKLKMPTERTAYGWLSKMQKGKL